MHTKDFHEKRIVSKSSSEKWHFKRVLGFEHGSKLICTPMVGGGGNQLYLQPEAGGKDRAPLPGEDGQILQVYIIQ